MKTFTIGRGILAICEFENTRSGFRHLATLVIDGNDVATVKCTYQNRTWERYEFESVLEKLRDESLSRGLLSQYHQRKFKRLIADNWQKKADAETSKKFQTVALIAKVGNIFTEDQKQGNDWKVRMLQAGLPGLSIPEDWDTLSEDEKQSRLDKVISELSSK
jgi:hypothetical protein